MAGHSDEVSHFYEPAADSSVINRQYIDYKPVGQLNSGAIEFHIPGSGSRYIDMKRTVLHITCKIVQGDGTPIPKYTIDVDSSGIPIKIDPKANVGPVNLFMHSLFQQVDCMVQQQMVSAEVATRHPYKSMFDVLLTYGMDAKDSKLITQLYVKDTGNLDDSNAILGTNNGLTERQELSKDSKYIYLAGPIHHDLHQQERLMLNSVEINYKFWPASNSFKLMSNYANADFKVEIKSAILRVCMVEMNPQLIVAEANALKIKPALFFYEKSDIKCYSIPQGDYALTVEDLYKGKVPFKMVIALVRSDGFNGSYSRNPFNFQTFSCNFIGFYVDGQSSPGAPLTPNFDEGDYNTAYMTLFGDDYISNSGLHITKNDFKSGYAIYTIDLCRSTCDKFTKVPMEGHTRLELKFAKALPCAVTAIIYAKFPGRLEINEQRNVNIK